MVPGVKALKALPLSPNGKVDRRSIAVAGARAAETRSVVPGAATPGEEMLAAIWGELLGIERVGVQDDFFDGGTFAAGDATLFPSARGLSNRIPASRDLPKLLPSPDWL